MTDFLKRVSQMALGQPPVVEPLLVSRYAPATPAADASLFDSSYSPLEERRFESGLSHAPGMFSTEAPLTEYPSEQAQRSHSEAPSPAPPTTVAGPTGGLYQEQAAANDRRPEGSAPLLQEPGTTKAASSLLPPSGGASERAALMREPFRSSTSQTLAPLNAQGPNGPVRDDDKAGPMELSRARMTPPDAEREQWRTSMFDGVDHATPGVEMLAARVMDARNVRNASEASDDPHTAPDAADSRSNPRQGGAAFKDTYESIQRANENERSSRLMPFLAMAPIDRRGSVQDGFTPGARTEHDTEALRTGRRGESSMPLRSDSNSFAQPAPGRADSHLLSSPDDGASNGSHERVIHITIGRVEVRAVMPSTPPKPVVSPAPPAPKLSLDEYLRQHNGRPR
ncbi:MAG TPA: hypothetical protein VGX92_13995 [Pyrinomonadaceae bacterium]|nr:hypothetical protein [Pyrinomonadaceae bacterium]